jgi:hypothetical protein
MAFAQQCSEAYSDYAAAIVLYSLARLPTEVHLHFITDISVCFDMMRTLPVLVLSNFLTNFNILM